MSSRLQTQAHYPFATATYSADKNGVLRAELPSRCVYATEAQTCRIIVDHYRSRKTGPRFPVAVVYCSVHPQHCYTLYPPGHFPYGREAVAPYSPSGELQLEGDTGQPSWQATLFAAAVDAEKGESWPAESLWDDFRRRRTQGRRLEFTGRLLGVHPQLAEGLREQIATRLAVATMKLLDGAKSWVEGWKKRGEAVQTVLLAILLQASLLDRILAAGAVTGLWVGRHPQRWDVHRGSWVMAPLARSEGAEHPHPACPNNRSPPPTN